MACDAICNWEPYACDYEGQTFNPKTCNCTCPNEAEVKPTCADPQFFSPKRGCQCVDVCEPQLAPLYGCPFDNQVRIRILKSITNFLKIAL